MRLQLVVRRVLAANLSLVFVLLLCSRVRAKVEIRAVKKGSAELLLAALAGAHVGAKAVLKGYLMGQGHYDTKKDNGKTEIIFANDRSVLRSAS